MPHPSPTGPREDETTGADPGEEFDPAACSAPRPANGPSARLFWIPAALLGGYIVYTAGYLGARHQSTPPPVTAVAHTALPARAIKVFVTGQVKRPGVYSLPAEARVEDALKMAGGSLPGADTSGLNLADWAVDGGKITVPARQRRPQAPPPLPQSSPPFGPDRYFPSLPRPISGEQANSEASEGSPRRRRTRRKAAPNPAVTGSQPPHQAGAGAAASAPKPRAEGFPTPVPTPTPLLPLDLNTASQADLEFLPGIGPKMATAILAQRAVQGRFGSVDELARVKGMGTKKLARLRPYLYVAGTP